MSNFDYKTVALPRSIQTRRKRRQSEADLVAEQLGQVLNDEAQGGWEYVRAETLTTPGAKGLFSKATPAAYVVLIFRKERDIPMPAETVTTTRSEAPVQPSVAASPAEPVEPLTSAPQPEVKIASTSMQLVSDTGSAISPSRPPLGSAQD